MVEKGADLKLIDKEDKTPFNLLYVNENPSSLDAVEFMISKGSDEWSESLRSICGCEKVSSEVISYLLNKKADVNEAGSSDYDCSERNSLGMLCQNKNITLEALELLLSSKADPNFKDNDGNTSLHLILENDGYSLSFVQKLIEYKADPNITSKLNFFSLQVI